MLLKIFKETLYKHDFGVKINGELINDSRYADDTLILNDTFQGLQHLLNSINAVGQETRLITTLEKQKYAVLSRHAHTLICKQMGKIQRVSLYNWDVISPVSYTHLDVYKRQ